MSKYNDKVNKGIHNMCVCVCVCVCVYIHTHIHTHPPQSDIFWQPDEITLNFT